MLRPRFILASAAVWVLAFIPQVRADILHLSNGGTVEGEIVEQTDALVRVRTVVGALTVPRGAIERIEPAPSPFAEYESKAAAAASAADQFALAQWCEQAGMMAERRTHLTRALELNPNFAPARAALGYVRVGELWAEARTVTERAAELPKADAPKLDELNRDDAQIVQAIQINWGRRIRALRQSHLEGSLDRLVRAGREQILSIKDPLAILPMVRELGNAERVSRLVLVEALSSFPQDEATMNLAVLALVDLEPSIREQALSQLVRRKDPRVAAQFRVALGSDNETLIRRAAVGVGVLGAAEAVPDLIKLLTTQKNKWVEMPTRTYFGQMSRVFSTPTAVTIVRGGQSVTHSPQIGLADSVGYVRVQNEFRLQNVTVFRTEVLEALRRITGQDFGFDASEWRRWYEEKRP